MLGRPEVAAPQLLGAHLETRIDRKRVVVRLVELEAYGGSDDPASHAFRARTSRNGPMFDDAGTVYVYRSYGIHWCANIVTGPPGSPSAVLLRGGEVLEGINIVEARRGRIDHLTDGPGKLCQALGIDGSMSGTLLNNGPIRLRLSPPPSDGYDVSPRVGVTKAVDRPWRFQER
ncbi:MAG: DNA-3-methyladenine glycosylase [Acidimicrobiia bacterium]